MSASGKVWVSGVRAIGHNQYDVDVHFNIAFDYGGRNGAGAYYEIYCDGQKASGKKAFNIPNNNGTLYWVDWVQHTFRITMPASGVAKTIQLSAHVNTGIAPPTISANGSHNLSARVWQWVIEYNANGGSNPPGNQIKVYNQNLQLSSHKPNRDGYSFSKWKASNGILYDPGVLYTVNASTTMTAQWDINKYTITFDSNGGTGGPTSIVKDYNVDVTIPTNTPTLKNYTFKGWGVSPSSTTPSYNSGGRFTDNINTTLYAIWELSYTAPRIYNLKADRCDSYGNFTEDGWYAKVTFDWYTDRSVTEIKVQCNGYTSYVNQNGTSGSASIIIGSNSLNTERSYEVVINISDSNGKSDYRTTVEAIAYIIDLHNSGSGISFGKPSSKQGIMEIAYPTEVMKYLYNDTKTGGMWLYARDHSLIKQLKSNDNNYNPLATMKVDYGAWSIGVIYGDVVFTYQTDDDYNAGINTPRCKIYFKSDGTIESNGRALGDSELLINDMSISEGSTISIPSSPYKNYLIMLKVSNGYTSEMIIKSDRSTHRITNYWSSGTAVSMAFNLASDNSLKVSRLYKEGAWAGYGAQIRIYGF